MILEISFSNIDFRSILVCVVGIGVVFAALALLVIVFTNIPKIGHFFIKVKLHGFKGALGLNDKKDTEDKGVFKELDLRGGDSAAIAAAIYLFLNEIHDDENRVMTIKRVARTYSPWNSKIYGVNWLRSK
ncbi:MAG: OadG family protein [Bacteroidales bacterium]|nr:OadG family protein [Bacteroidales bacterium]